MVGAAEAFHILFKHLHQGILVEHDLAGVGGIVRQAQHAGGDVQQAQVQEGLGVAVAAAAEAVVGPLLVVVSVVAHLAVDLHAQQRRVHVAFLTAVAPAGGEDQRHSVLAAGGQSGDGIGDGGGISGSGAHPGPDAAGEDHGGIEEGMLADGVVVHLDSALIVVPVDQGDPLVHGGDGLGGGVLLAVVVQTVGLEVHIAPHHGVQAVLLADVQQPLQVALHDEVGVLIAAAVQMGTAAQAPGLVHAQVDPLGAVGSGSGPDHLLQDHIGLLQVGLDDLAVLTDVMVGGPAHDPVQMAQGLDAGAKLDAEEEGVVVQGLQLIVGVAATLVAEEGLLGDLVGVLGVHHAQVQALEGHLAQEALQGLGGDDGIAGAVEHDAHGLEGGLLTDVADGEVFGDQAEGSVELDGLGPGDRDGGAVALYAQVVALHGGDGNALFAQAEAQLVLQLRKGQRIVLRGLAGDMDGRDHDILLVCWIFRNVRT